MVSSRPAPSACSTAQLTTGRPRNGARSLWTGPANRDPPPAASTTAADVTGTSRVGGLGPSQRVDVALAIEALERYPAGLAEGEFARSLGELAEQRGHEDLPPDGGPGDARSQVHGVAVEVVVDPKGLAGVEPDANTHGRVGVHAGILGEGTLDPGGA